MSASASELQTQILNKQRRALAKAITLVESTRPQDQTKAQELLEGLLPHTGNSFRIGITGSPGVGKSTLIESWGMQLLQQGKRVAVLSVDPSSPIHQGSILGDKTRMPQLAAHPDAFVRPSPSSGSLGGVGRRTRESILLCEAAGYDVILIETVGVGQSETLVASMVDAFMVLLLPNAGDELQGIKKGIIELADMMVVTKADQSIKDLALQAQQQYQHALQLLSVSENAWKPPVLCCSSLEHTGLDELWSTLQNFQQHQQTHQLWNARRQEQAVSWMKQLLQESIFQQFQEHPAVQTQLPLLEAQVQQQALLPTHAVQQLLQLFVAKQ